MVLCFAFMTYTSIYGNPAVYFKAKSEITRYIEENYKDVLNLESVSYSSKMSAYVGQVTDKDDSRCKSFIEYHPNSGKFYDDYQFRTMVNMEDELRVTIATLINASLGIPSEKISIALQIEIPEFKYRMFDKHDPNNPANLDLTVEVNYANIDEFSKDAYRILSVLYTSKLNFKKIVLYSFTPEDGNKAYYISLKEGEKATSLGDVKKTVQVKWMGK